MFIFSQICEYCKNAETEIISSQNDGTFNASNVKSEPDEDDDQQVNTFWSFKPLFNPIKKNSLFWF